MIVLSPIDDFRRYTSQPGMSSSNPCSLPQGYYPLTVHHSRDSWMHHRDVIQDRRPRPESLPSSRRLPRHHEQSNIRLRRHRPHHRKSHQRLRVLRDHSRRGRSWTRLGRHQRSTHPHNQHSHYRSRDSKRRYPVILHEFSLRRGSGGAGLHRGGDGCVRDMEFRIPLQVSILSDRRVTAPYGMAGGKEGKRGENVWIRKDPVTGSTRKVALGPRQTAHFRAGDRIVILTPGGGGWGEEISRDQKESVGLRQKIDSAGQSLLKTQGSLYERNAIAVGN